VQVVQNRPEAAKLTTNGFGRDFGPERLTLGNRCGSCLDQQTIGLIFERPGFEVDRVDVVAGHIPDRGAEEDDKVNGSVHRYLFRLTAPSGAGELSRNLGDDD
jgi:hypothetical protein